MEKTVSPEERIRRAEEIYYRRKLDNNSVRMSSSQVKDGREKKQFFLYKKVIIQVLICILIYLIFSLIKEANYIFSEEVLNKTKEFLSTDINFAVIADRTGKFFQDNQDKLNFFSSWLKEDIEENEQSENQINENKENEQNTETKNQETNEQENNKEQTNENGNVTNEAQTNEAGNVINEAKANETENAINESQSNSSTQNNNVVANTLTGIGGATSNEVTVTTSSTSNSAKKTQMQLDAEYFKANFSLTLPLKGTITSHYGEREETEIVSANHQGIDIGVNEGTTIVAAMAGTVSLVSDEGEYGTHIKIVNKDITTIYAHCSKILVKEGNTIKKGQKIALSGNTGRTTGPHLHFEIRRDNRTIDPELILSW